MCRLRRQKKALIVYLNGISRVFSLPLLPNRSYNRQQSVLCARESQGQCCSELQAWFILTLPFPNKSSQADSHRICMFMLLLAYSCSCSLMCASITAEFSWGFFKHAHICLSVLILPASIKSA